MERFNNVVGVKDEREDEQNCSKSLLHILDGINALHVVRSFLIP
jgi:hypothetical protein